MARPFVILGLPRSQTAWLSHYLAKGTSSVSHDLAVRCGSLDEFVKRLRDQAGTVETGAMLGWRCIREALPDVRLVVVRRPLSDVFASFARLGYPFDENGKTELARRNVMLDDAVQSPGVRTIQQSELAYTSQGKWLFECCKGEAFDQDWWNHMRGLNVQINISERIRFLSENKVKLEAFKAEVEQKELMLKAVSLVQGLVVGLERWQTCGLESDALAKAHFAEVDAGDEPWRKYQLDFECMEAMSKIGMLRFTTARLDGRLIGYIGWTVQLDPECLGVLTARQGPWYVVPKASATAAGRLWQTSLADLTDMGVQYAYPHRRLHGRGSELDGFFARAGAIQNQVDYALKLGAA